VRLVVSEIAVVRVAPPGLGLMGGLFPELRSSGFLLGYFPFLPPGGGAAADFVNWRSARGDWGGLFGETKRAAFARSVIV